MTVCRSVILLLCAGLSGMNVLAQDEPAQTTPESSDEREHAELRALRDALTEAVLKGDAEGQLAHADENIVTTWQNHRVVRGHDGLREFLEEMNSGNQKVFQGYAVPPTADELTILHGGDTGIAFGTSVPHYNFLGMEFDLENRWTATMIKQDGKWKIAAYHVSADITDNPLLSAAKNGLYWTSGVSLLVGLFVGGFGSRMFKKKPRPDA